MGRIVGAVQRVVANRLAGARSMDKVAVADINADMGNSSARIVSVFEEHQITGFDINGRNGSAKVI